MTQPRPARDVLGAALRRFWVVALVAGLVAGLATVLLVRATSTTSWLGEATFVVPIADAPPATPDGVAAVADPRTPGSPIDANRFAQAYSTLLVEDGALIAYLAEATGLAAEGITEGTQAVPVPDSAIIRVTFGAETEAQVDSYFAALAAAFAEEPAVTPNIVPGNVEPLRAVRTAEQQGVAPLAWVFGLVAALIAGLGGAVLLERSDPRLRNDDDVRRVVSWPVLVTPAEDDDVRNEVVVGRVVRTAGNGGAVGVLGVPGTPGDDVREATARLERVHAALGNRAPGGARPDAVRWVDAGPLAGDGTAARLAQEVDVVVLLAPVGSRLRHLEAAVRTLQDLTVTDVVVGLVPARRGGRSGSAREDHQDAPHAEAPRTGSPDRTDTSTRAPRTVGEQAPLDYPLTPRR